MKSYINELVAYQDLPLEKEAVVSCPEEHIQVRLKDLTRSGKKTEPATCIQKGDVVVLALASELEKFNRPAVFVTVGGNLFDAEFEAALIGHTVGETFLVTVQEKPVSVTVKQASRTVYPEATDEMAAEYAKSHEEYEGVETVAQYRERTVENYLKEHHDDAYYEAMQQLVDYVLTHSDWEFDEEELKEQIEKEKEYLNKELEEEGLTLDSLTSQDLETRFGIASREELEKEIRASAEQQIAISLWMMTMHGKNPAECTEEELDGLGWEFLEKYVRETITVKEER